MTNDDGRKPEGAPESSPKEKRRRALEDWNAYATGGEVRQAAE
jgi:hypothetical protein